MQNPLFPTNDNAAPQIPDYLQTRPVQGAPGAVQAPVQIYQPQNPVAAQPALVAASAPTPRVSESLTDNSAADLIRQKVAAIYAAEPDAKQEIADVIAARAPLSKHQQYMQALNNSGRSWAEIQNAWHEYYTALPDHEKHEVWREFNSANQGATPFQREVQQQDLLAAAQAQQAALNSDHAQAVQQPANSFQYNQPGQSSPAPAVIPADYTPARASQPEQPSGAGSTRLTPTVADIKQRILSSVSSGGKFQNKQHVQSLAFGLASGAVVVIIFLFGFFNELFITPFVQPSRRASETPVIVNTASAVVGTTPKVLIPKINVEIPVVYDTKSTAEEAIQEALNSGVAHYPTTARPGQAGNAAFFGHSSNNIFNPGKYKFAFVLLNRLVVGDTFYLTYEGKAYAYEVITRRVVPPTEVSVLGPVPGQTATATLITCDPPGTSINRLVVVGKQISPDPAGNPTPAAPTPDQSAPVQTATATDLPGNGPTLWSRFWGSIF